jgi:hypothetical protein
MSDQQGAWHAASLHEAASPGAVVPSGRSYRRGGRTVGAVVLPRPRRR